MDEQQAWQLTATALADAIREFGRSVVDNPSRLRALLTDVLAADSVTLRPQIAAVVAVAECGAARALEQTAALTPESRAALVSQVAATGVPPADAARAVEAWAAALLPFVRSTATELPTEPTVLPVAATELPVAATQLPVAAAASAGSPSGHAGFLQRRGMIAAAAAAVLALGGGGAAFLATSGGGGDTVDIAHVALPSSSASATPSAVPTVAPTRATTPVKPSATPKPAVAATTAPRPAATTAPRPRSTYVAPRPRATTAAPVPKPKPKPVVTTAAPVPAPVARAEAWSYTPQVCTDGSCWKIATLTIRNASGTWDSVVIDDVYYGHANVTGGDAVHFQPHHNGTFREYVYFRLYNSDTGRYSNQAIMTVDVQCNSAYTCYG